MPSRAAHQPVATGLAVFSLAAVVTGKPIHYEDVKSQLLEQNIRCTACHVSATDPALTSYGKRIGELGTTTSVADRVRMNEEELSQTATDDDRKRAAGRVDVDSDGVANWVEILSGTDPSVSNERTDAHATIEKTVSCMLCHTSVDRFPTPGRERAPHNAFGEALAEIGQPKGRTRKPPRDDEPTRPILPRLQKLRGRDTDGDKVRDLDELGAFHHPADTSDTPDVDAVKSYTESQKARKRDDGAGYGPTHAPPR